ncbi:MAG TPA: trehalose-phosphatase [Rhizomicrobium sp.]
MTTIERTGAPVPRDFSLSRDVFLLDVDGTIIDIASTPESVRVPSSLIRTLVRLHEKSGGALALVSGRTLASLDRLFAPLILPCIACHGAEWRTQPQDAGEPRAAPLPEALRQALVTVATREPRVRVEDKGYTMAFHYRSAMDREAPLLSGLAEAVAPFAKQFRLLEGKAVAEIKPRSFDKGEAVRALLQVAPFAGRRPVFFGDDTTDRDALAVVRAMGGIGVSVGAALPNADLLASTPHTVRVWLAHLVGSAGETID